MNSPTTTPMRANEMEGVSDAKVQASAEGTITLVMIWGSEEARGVDEVGVDAPRALEGVEEDDEEHDAPGQHDLGEQTEAEDHRDERHQRDAGQRVERHDVGLEHAGQPVAAPEHQAGHEAGGDAGEEAPDGGLHGRERHLPDGEPYPGRHQVDEPLRDRGGPADEERIDPVEP